METEMEIWSNILDDYEIGRLTRFYPKHANLVRPSSPTQAHPQPTGGRGRDRRRVQAWSYQGRMERQEGKLWIVGEQCLLILFL